MTWNDDLAELKKKLPVAPTSSKTDAPAGGPRRAAGKTRSDIPASLEDEDQQFLAAMGLSTKPSSPKPAEVNRSSAPNSLHEEDHLFLASVSAPRSGSTTPSLVASPSTDHTEQLKKIFAPPVSSVPESSTVPPAQVPPPEDLSVREIHLASGMSLEVDAHLDLRRFTDQDGLARFEERIEEGIYLGWHHLWVEFASDGTLSATIRQHLRSGRYPMIRQFASAPERMGGPHALILYYPPSL
ncbi:MAG: hypothetical protein ACKN9J_00875 [Holophagaceae bacterium]